MLALLLALQAQAAVVHLAPALRLQVLAAVVHLAQALPHLAALARLPLLVHRLPPALAVQVVMTAVN